MPENSVLTLHGAPHDGDCDTWLALLDKLKKQIPTQVFTYWIESIVFISLVEDTLTLQVVNSFHEDWLNNNYQEKIISMLKGMGLSRIEKIKYLYSEKESEASLGEEEASDSNIDIFASEPKKKNFSKKVSIQSGLIRNREYTFDGIIAGKGNELPIKAAKLLAESAKAVYNPLVVYGDVGSGKTVLLHAIGNELKNRNPELNIKYLSVERFFSEMVDAHYNGKTNSFRNHYHNEVDVLLMDDIHKIEKKFKTQEELEILFAEMELNCKQMVFATSTPIKKLVNVSDRLISRLNSGLCVELDKPDNEHRLAIIRDRVSEEGTNISESVQGCIADVAEGNCREIISVLTKVIAYKSLSGMDLTTEEVKKIIYSQIEIKELSLTTQRISEVVAKIYGIESVNELKKKTRKKNIVLARQITMYLTRKLTDETLEAIGGYFNRDHATVIHSLDKIANSLVLNPKIQRQLEFIQQKLTA